MSRDEDLRLGQGGGGRREGDLSRSVSPGLASAALVSPTLQGRGFRDDEDGEDEGGEREGEGPLRAQQEGPSEESKLGESEVDSDGAKGTGPGRWAKSDWDDDEESPLHADAIGIAPHTPYSSAQGESSPLLGPGRQVPSFGHGSSGPPSGGSSGKHDLRRIAMDTAARRRSMDGGEEERRKVERDESPVATPASRSPAR